MNYINYYALYSDFLEDSGSVFPVYIRRLLSGTLEKQRGSHMSYKTLWRINKIICYYCLERRSISTTSGQLKSYDEDFIRHILDHQKSHGLSNSQTSNMFELSRNTLSRWRGIYGY